MGSADDLATQTQSLIWKVRTDVPTSAELPPHVRPPALDALHSRVADLAMLAHRWNWTVRMEIQRRRDPDQKQNILQCQEAKRRRIQRLVQHPVHDPHDSDAEYGPEDDDDPPVVEDPTSDRMQLAALIGVARAMVTASEEQQAGSAPLSRLRGGGLPVLDAALSSLPDLTRSVNSAGLDSSVRDRMLRDLTAVQQSAERHAAKLKRPAPVHDNGRSSASNQQLSVDNRRLNAPAIQHIQPPVNVPPVQPPVADTLVQPPVAMRIEPPVDNYESLLQNVTDLALNVSSQIQQRIRAISVVAAPTNDLARQLDAIQAYLESWSTVSVQLQHQ